MDDKRSNSAPDDDRASAPADKNDSQHEKRPEGPYKDPNDEKDQATIK
jgi:hypothetical protein